MATKSNGTGGSDKTLSDAYWNIPENDEPILESTDIKIRETRDRLMNPERKLTESDQIMFDCIQAIIGRELTRAEQQSIAENIAIFSAMRTNNKALKITTQKIKRGLDSFIKLPDDKVKAAYKAAHVLIRTEIQGALCAMKLPHSAFDVTCNSSAVFIAAATMARNKIKDGIKGSSGYRQNLARYILALWQSLGRTDLAAWDNPENGMASPLVQFAMALIEVAEPKSELSFSRVRKILCEVVA